MKIRGLGVDPAVVRCPPAPGEALATVVIPVDRVAETLLPIETQLERTIDYHWFESRLPDQSTPVVCLAGLRLGSHAVGFGPPVASSQQLPSGSEMYALVPPHALRCGSAVSRAPAASAISRTSARASSEGRLSASV